MEVNLHCVVGRSESLSQLETSLFLSCSGQCGSTTCHGIGSPFAASSPATVLARRYPLHIENPGQE